MVKISRIDLKSITSRKRLYSLGINDGTTSFGNTIKVYNVERTICDIVRSRNRIDVQILAEEMIKQGLMMPCGQAAIDLAKKEGTWDALSDAQNLVIPDDLHKLFDENEIALKNFQHFHLHQNE